MFDARRIRLRVGALAILGAAALVTLGFTNSPLRRLVGPPAVATSSPAPPNPAAIVKLEDLSDAFADVAARVKPSVVYIIAKHSAEVVAQRPHGNVPPQTIPPELAPFFRGPGGGAGPEGPDSPDMPGAIASGSGFIVSPDGYILTNNHVVEGASTVTVRLLDRREFKARVVGSDPATDVAVLKINASGLNAAPLANSDSTRVGEWVLAVGNPLGENLTFTVTQGIVSAKGRTALNLPGSSGRSIQDFIQTDAAINPGNSGGPLVNVRGQVIGINAAIASPTGFNTGYGFAVPMNLARTVMQQIIATGHVERAALGVTVRDASADDAAYVGLSTIGGVLVEDYGSSDSPAKRAGIQPGDVIIAVDGHPVTYVAQLQEAIAFRKAGDVVSIEVARKGGARETLRVPLQQVGAEQVADVAHAGDHAGGSASGTAAPMLGVTVAPTDESVVNQLQLPDGVRGVVVTNVDDGGPASGRLATPEQGGPDIIMSVEGTAVSTPDGLRDALRTASHAASGDTAPIVSLRIYNVPSKTRRVERIRLVTSSN
jgi:serine protease Do